MVLDDNPSGGLVLELAWEPVYIALLELLYTFCLEPGLEPDDTLALVPCDSPVLVFVLGLEYSVPGEPGDTSCGNRILSTPPCR